MNKFQRKESRDIHRMITDYPFGVYLESNYKIVRRNFRKTCRHLQNVTKQAHKSAISMALSDGPDVSRYIRRDLFNTICYARPIEVKNE